MFEYKTEQARLAIPLLHRKMAAMGAPDLKNIQDEQHLAAYMMLYIAARIYANVDTNHFGGRDRYGHVGAVIIIPGVDQIIFYQSKKMGFGWYHAERGALRVARRFAKRHGYTLKDCILIVSMEPCVGDVPGRIGCSCSKLVKEQTFSKVYVGYRDRTLANWFGRMPKWPSNWTLINDSYVNEVARELYDFFGIWYDSRKKK